MFKTPKERVAAKVEKPAAAPPAPTEKAPPAPADYEFSKEEKQALNAFAKRLFADEAQIEVTFKRNGAAYRAKHQAV